MQITAQLRTDRRGNDPSAWLHFTGVTFTVDERRMLTEEQTATVLELLGNALAGITVAGPLVPLMRP